MWRTQYDEPKHPPYFSLEALTIATIAERIASGADEAKQLQSELNQGIGFQVYFLVFVFLCKLVCKQWIEPLVSHCFRWS